jgi:hypothetical protein
MNLVPLMMTSCLLEKSALIHRLPKESSAIFLEECFCVLLAKCMLSVTQYILVLFIRHNTVELIVFSQITDEKTVTELLKSRPSLHMS